MPCQRAQAHMHASCCCMPQSQPSRCFAFSVHCLLMAGVRSAAEDVNLAGPGSAMSMHQWASSASWWVPMYWWGRQYIKLHAKSGLATPSMHLHSHACLTPDASIRRTAQTNIAPIGTNESSFHSPGATAGGAAAGCVQPGHPGAGGPCPGGPRLITPRLARGRAVVGFQGDTPPAIEQHQGLQTGGGGPAVPSAGAQTKALQWPFLI